MLWWRHRDSGLPQLDVLVVQRLRGLRNQLFDIADLFRRSGMELLVVLRARARREGLLLGGSLKRIGWQAM